MMFLMTADAALSAEFRQHTNLTYQQALSVVKDVCIIFRAPIEAVERRLGYSLATGLPLLDAGKQSISS